MLTWRVPSDVISQFLQSMCDVYRIEKKDVDGVFSTFSSFVEQFKQQKSRQTLEQLIDDERNEEAKQKQKRMSLTLNVGELKIEGFLQKRGNEGLKFWKRRYDCHRYLKDKNKTEIFQIKS